MYIMWPWPLLYQGVNLSISSLNCFNNIKIKDISHMFAKCPLTRLDDWVKVINVYYFSINEADILLMASLSLLCLARLLIFLLIFFLHLIDSLFKQKLEDDKKPLFSHIWRSGEGQYGVNVNVSLNNNLFQWRWTVKSILNIMLWNGIPKRLFSPDKTLQSLDQVYHFILAFMFSFKCGNLLTRWFLRIMRLDFQSTYHYV